jgi:2-methylisocitrate lyase-like PEP mutase family enzyme
VSKKTQTLRAAIDAPGILVAPGVYDAISAHIAEKAGFQAVFVSGSSLATTHLARPDIGLLDMSEIAEIVARMADRISIPMLIDADQGFGNAMAVSRTVRAFERAGASAIQIEDQLEVKPRSAPLSRPLIALEDMVAKIKTAQDSRADDSFMISARTDAMTTAGIDEALRRAHAFAAAGADMIFVESLAKRADMERLVAEIGGTVPLLHNLLRSGEDVSDAATLDAMGYSVALFPGVAVQAVGSALERAFSSLASDARVETPSVPDLIGAKEYLARFI